MKGDGEARHPPKSLTLKGQRDVILNPLMSFLVTPKQVEIFQRNFSYPWSITKDVRSYDFFEYAIKF